MQTQSDNRRAYQREWVRRARKTNPDKYRASCRNYYGRNSDQVKATAREYYRRNAEKLKAGKRAQRSQLRTEMLRAYGNHCTCCGEANKEFLTLEHINNTGAAHRKQLGLNRGRGGMPVYRDLKRRGWPKEGFTILCWNCNSARAYHGYCPHALPVDSWVQHLPERESDATTTTRSQESGS